MKKIVLSLMLIINSLFATAQKQEPAPTPPDMPMDTTTKLITYTEVVQMPEVQAAELFKRAKKWVYIFYKNPSTVIQTMDSVNYVFEGRHTINMIKTLKDGTKLPTNYMNYNITLNFKDGKYRYKITNINLKDLSYHPAEKLLDEKDPPTRDWDYQMLQQTDDFMQNNLIPNLKKAMTKPSNEVKTDNW
jgi:hypothetical protein